MDISKANKDEVRYQHRNYAKHVEISALFGWGALDKFYLPENLDHATPRHATPRHATPRHAGGQRRLGRR